MVAMVFFLKRKKPRRIECGWGRPFTHDKNNPTRNFFIFCGNCVSWSPSPDRVRSTSFESDTCYHLAVVQPLGSRTRGVPYNRSISQSQELVHRPLALLREKEQMVLYIGTREDGLYVYIGNVFICIHSLFFLCVCRGGDALQTVCDFCVDSNRRCWALSWRLLTNGFTLQLDRPTRETTGVLPPVLFA